ncbi:MAG: MFS transporter [Sphingomonadales bacterium]|nr:MFS transporter [Sphingomonadales bacterium]
MGDRHTPTARGEWAANWTLVLAASVGFSFFSVMLAGAGLFMAPIEHEFHWSRSAYALGPSVATLATALLAVPFGFLVDRWGCRRLVLAGTVLTMAAMAAFSRTGPSPTLWLVQWAVFGTVAVSIKSTAWTAAVVGVFERSRGLALGLTLAGTAVAAMVVPPLGNWLIESYGWRAAFLWLALGWGGVTLLLSWLFFFDAHDRARLGQADKVDTSGLPGLTPRQALRDSALWRLAISNFVVMVLTMGLGLHMIQILVEAGVTRGHAAWLTSLGGLMGIVGKLVTGALLDRFAPNWVGGITLGAAAAAFVLLLNGIATPAAIVAAMLVNGYASGSKTQITGHLTASYGGMKSFGAIYGVMSSLLAAASGLGPYLAAVAHDRAGSYGPFLVVGAIGCALSGLIMISMPRYPAWDRRTGAAA